jgi:DNA-binding GntR family transcriptional regulator
VADEGAMLDALRDVIVAGKLAARERLIEVHPRERSGCRRFAVRAAIPVRASQRWLNELATGG